MPSTNAGKDEAAVNPLAKTGAEEADVTLGGGGAGVQ